MEEELNLYECPKCGLRCSGNVRDNGPHRTLYCGNCDAYIKNLPKEHPVKTRRPPGHRKMVAKYGNGYCELCLVLEEKIPNGETLEGHHIVEFQDGGEDTKENTMIVCTA